MARNMDKHLDKIKKFEELKEQATEVGRHYRAICAERDRMETEIIDAMQTSTVATVGGQPVFEVVETSRDSCKKENVLRYAKSVAHLIIETKYTPHIKFFPKV